MNIFFKGSYLCFLRLNMSKLKFCRVMIFLIQRLLIQNNPSLWNCVYSQLHCKITNQSSSFFCLKT